MCLGDGFKGLNFPVPATQIEFKIQNVSFIGFSSEETWDALGHMKWLRFGSS
jgi:hypothetical protein